MRHYFFGDIHGHADLLDRCVSNVKKESGKNDMFVFLGDYIDRGPESFEVVEYLVDLSKKQKTYFLMGNHELMLFDYLTGKESSRNIYFSNGGKETIRSYESHLGPFTIPKSHLQILFSQKYFYICKGAIAVHAGVDGNVPVQETDNKKLVWIREKFYYGMYSWKETIIFGHTPTYLLGEALGEVHWDYDRNIVGIDTGSAYGGPLSCLVWPDKRIIQSS